MKYRIKSLIQECTEMNTYILNYFQQDYKKTINPMTINAVYTQLI